MWTQIPVYHKTTYKPYKNAFDPKMQLSVEEFNYKANIINNY